LRKFVVFRALGNLSIRSKVVAAFAVVLALTVGLGAFAVQRLQSVESASAEIRDNWMPSVAAASRLEAAWKDYRLALARHVVSTNFMDLLGIGSARRSRRFKPPRATEKTNGALRAKRHRPLRWPTVALPPSVASVRTLPFFAARSPDCTGRRLVFHARLVQAI
jgi:hypothetical protein